MKKFSTLLFTMLLAACAWSQTGASVPEGTALMVKLDNTLTTFHSKAGDPFSGHVTEAVIMDGKTVIPVGATVQGRVTKVTEPRRFAGKSTITIFPENLVLPDGQRFVLNASLVDTSRRGRTDVTEEGEFKGAGHSGRDMTEIAAGTGGGMLIGGLIGGGPGLLIGGAVGATATTAHWLVRRTSATLPAGTELTMELSRPLEMGVTAPAVGQ
jgi:hypothetical protein